MPRVSQILLSLLRAASRGCRIVIVFTPLANGVAVRVHRQRTGYFRTARGYALDLLALVRSLPKELRLRLPFDRKAGTVRLTLADTPNVSKGTNQLDDTEPAALENDAAYSDLGEFLSARRAAAARNTSNGESARIGLPPTRLVRRAIAPILRQVSDCLGIDDRAERRAAVDELMAIVSGSFHYYGELDLAAPADGQRKELDRLLGRPALTEQDFWALVGATQARIAPHYPGRVGASADWFDARSFRIAIRRALDELGPGAKGRPPGSFQRTREFVGQRLAILYHHHRGAAPPQSRSKARRAWSHRYRVLVRLVVSVLPPELVGHDDDQAAKPHSFGTRSLADDGLEARRTAARAVTKRRRPELLRQLDPSRWYR